VSYCVNGTICFGCSGGTFTVPVFVYFFQKFSNFCGQMCGLGLTNVKCTFTKFLPVQPTAHVTAGNTGGKKGFNAI